VQIVLNKFETMPA